jgi:heme exporter protein A
MFSVTDLSCSRGERRLFTGLNLDVKPGEWLQVGGANGAGKTTLLRTLVGLAHADAGQIRWDGRAIADCADDYRAAMLYLGHQPGVKDDLTPLENVQQALGLDGFPVDEAAALEALAQVGLRGRGHLPTRVLSAGQKRRTVQARLLLRPARLWVLDEPFTALDASAIGMLCSHIQAHLAQGGMVILTSHQAVPLDGGMVLTL